LKKQIELIPAGQSLKTFGVKGELKIELDELLEEYILDSKVIFIPIEGNYVPYFITDYRESDTLLIQIKEIDTPEQAQALHHKKIYIDKNQIPPIILKQWENKSLHADFDGYTILDQTSELEFQLIAIEEYPGQTVAHVDHDGITKTIPLNEDLIIEINHGAKRITMQLAEGIFDL